MLLHLTLPALLLAVAEERGTLHVMSLPSQTPLWPISHAHSGEITALAWSPDGQLLASGGRDGLVRLWLARDGLCWCAFPFAHQAAQLQWSSTGMLTCFSAQLISSWAVPRAEIAS